MSWSDRQALVRAGQVVSVPLRLISSVEDLLLLVRLTAAPELLAKELCVQSVNGRGVLDEAHKSQENGERQQEKEERPDIHGGEGLRVGI